ncbi:diguanylate cyclase [Sphingomonas naphthae]|uniref:Diguanylate cyclase n=1 Tax=Sphingomonas naphthae TaxID=1813468 RepID=A0ABY7TFT4_9SPHN|nr:diguanylate cyclase [Sphingomonas naphthae]WCT72004.1 diguanylate cyclase [Sphingomonas naphthae]
MLHATPASPIEACDAERLRLERLAALDILDSPREREFDAVVAIASRLLDCPMALVSLVDDHRQWFKASCGIDAVETPRDIAFCAHAIRHDDIMVVPNATLDPRFAANPLVTGDPRIRFYAGVPLRLWGTDGIDGIGTLCVIDIKPRLLTEADAAVLRDLAALVCALIRARSTAADAIRLSSELQERCHALDRQHRQFRHAERLAQIGSWRLPIGGDAVEWSDQVYEIYGLPLGVQPPLDKALDHYLPHDRPTIAAALERTIAGQGPYDIETEFVTATGQRRRVRSVGELEVIDGRPVAAIGVFQDVTRQYEMEQALRRNATTDALTGIPNRAHFTEMLAGKFAQAQAEDGPLALLLIDLDGFKQVNDSFGHIAGDGLLQLMAERLRKPARAHAFVARLGGDEFVMLISRPRDCARLETLVAGLLRDLRHTVSQDGQTRAVSATIGAAMVEPDMAGPADLIHKADLALYHAKREQRGTARIHGRDMPIMAARPATTRLGGTARGTVAG